MADVLAQLDSGFGGINWNALLSGAVNTYGQIETIKATKQAAIYDQTPVAATSPVQVGHNADSGIPQIYILGGIALLGVILLMRQD